MALNKDIGFIETGQIAEIKIEAFPFTRYGLIDGMVTQISADAVADEQLGLVYPLKASMEQTKVLVDNRFRQACTRHGGQRRSQDRATPPARILPVTVSQISGRGSEREMNVPYLTPGPTHEGLSAY